MTTRMRREQSAALIVEALLLLPNQPKLTRKELAALTGLTDKQMEAGLSYARRIRWNEKLLTFRSEGGRYTYQMEDDAQAAQLDVNHQSKHLSTRARTMLHFGEETVEAGVRTGDRELRSLGMGIIHKAGLIESASAEAEFLSQQAMERVQQVDGSYTLVQV